MLSNDTGKFSAQKCCRIWLHSRLNLLTECGFVIGDATMQYYRLVPPKRCCFAVNFPFLKFCFQHGCTWRMLLGMNVFKLQRFLLPTLSHLNVDAPHQFFNTERFSLPTPSFLLTIMPPYFMNKTGHFFTTEIIQIMTAERLQCTCFVGWMINIWEVLFYTRRVMDYMTTVCIITPHERRRYL